MAKPESPWKFFDEIVVNEVELDSDQTDCESIEGELQEARALGDRDVDLKEDGADEDEAQEIVVCGDVDISKIPICMITEDQNLQSTVTTLPNDADADSDRSPHTSQEESASDPSYSPTQSASDQSEEEVAVEQTTPSPTKQLRSPCSSRGCRTRGGTRSKGCRDNTKALGGKVGRQRGNRVKKISKSRKKLQNLHTTRRKLHYVKNPEKVAAAPEITAPPAKKSRIPSRSSKRQKAQGGSRDKSRSDDSESDGEAGCHKSHSVKEECVHDEDVPPKQQENLRELLETGDDTKTHLTNKYINMDDCESDDEWKEDEDQDAESFIVQELFKGDARAVEFDWLSMDSFCSRREEFKPKCTGYTGQTACAYEAFRQYWDDEILQHIVRETNRHASQLKSTSSRFAQEWYDTNVHEILILFAFWMMLGIIRMPSITSCFSDNPLLKTSVFRNLLTQPRYWALSKTLHFVDNSTRTANSSKLFPLGPVAEHLNKNFKACYIPDQNISIGESSLLWKVQKSIKLSNGTKAAQCGIKSYELCESSTGYLWSFSIYTLEDRATSASNKLPKNIDAVVKLIEPLLNKGYTVFLDNCVNSPILARFLKRNSTDCVGTLHRSRNRVPAVIQQATVSKGRCVARHANDVMIMKYQDVIPVFMLSTYHGTESINYDSTPDRPSHYQPAILRDYNKAMMGNVTKDQMLGPYLMESKNSREWYKTVFKRLLNVSISNSQILVHRSKGDALTHQVFRLELVQKIIGEHLKHVPRPGQTIIECSNVDGLPNDRLSFPSSVHFIVRGSDGLSAENKGNRTSESRYCIWCLVREKRSCKTIYECDTCEVPLCLEGCFKKFHTVP